MPHATKDFLVNFVPERSIRGRDDGMVMTGAVWLERMMNEVSSLIVVLSATLALFTNLVPVMAA